MSVHIRFLGGAGTVTGSKYLVEHDGHSVLVDCGLFQGYKQLRLRNRDPLPILPNNIGAVILTHAHLDHSGYLPLLANEGFHGKVWTTPATRDLAQILLPDSGHIQEEDAAFANRKGFSKHAPALPLYTEDDARRSLKLIRTARMNQVFEPVPGWTARFSGAGHILGAASLLLEVGGRRILFSGDLGRPDDAIMLAPENPPAADVVVCESTYGDREHPDEDVLAELGPALQRVAARGGTVVVPAFAVGRAQALLHAIAELKAAGTLPSGLPVYLDSPMAIHSTELFAQHLGEHRLNAAQCHAMATVATMTRTPDESKTIALQHGPKVIISASGMATGGRVLHHLAKYLGDHRNMVLLTGYQAPGTRGASLAHGATQLRMHGKDIPVRAEIVQLASASAHADAGQLLAWLRALPGAPRRVFVVHGDPEASDRLRYRIENELRWQALVPEHGSTWQA
ncbi:metallo-beta-lactamase family protein [Hydrogenophaga palleronii]|uniref:Metallo-beta-lactamase family protein n=1 Tax=Hydrogenophaga palleronii TaxID=65655 RepID=A0ABU1WI79_9BURK|nr:MBL fold metallo-hydrolase [Hydrogenophaga palleronii]MDR7148978.1 metallo-beta-lactamase family protein [Hydrogenophaga palleronii]